ncbi:MAG: hypothetical protein U0R50_09910 [Gaiellales bacterium]
MPLANRTTVVLALLAVFGLVATVARAATVPSAVVLPSVKLTEVPAGTVALGAPVRIAWTLTGAAGTTCVTDAGASKACASPLTLTSLGAGAHTVTITAKGRRGSATAKVTWAVVAPPTLTKQSGPAGTTTEASATLAWAASGTTTQTCSRDGAAPAACTSPVTLTALASGAHTFTVNAANVVGAATTTWSWTVAPPPPAPGVQAPLAPATYAIPAGATVVRTASELTAALAGPSQDIVLADGTYDAAAPFTNANGHRLYAQNLGKAVLTAGLVVGGNYGSPTTVVRGLVFDVSSPVKALGGGIVHVWGPGGTNAKILDCVFKGNNVIPYGVLALNPDGLTLQRAQLSSFTDVAVRVSDNVNVAYGAATPVVDTISDVSIDGVSRPTPGASNGTAEAGLWVGHPVRNGVSRIRVRNVSWSGIETVNNAWDTRFTDLDVDMGGAKQAAGVAVYLEHYTRNVTFDGFVIKGARTGFNGEWADPATGGKPGAHTVTIRNGQIDAAGSALSGRQAGVYLDEGSFSTTVTGVTFLNQSWAGIGAYKTAGVNTFTDNTFRLGPAGVSISNEHI